MDEVQALLDADRRQAEVEAANDQELVRIGGQFVRLTQQPGWTTLASKVQEMRTAMARQVLDDPKIDVAFVRGQADGAQKVLVLVETAILAAQEALRRIQSAEPMERARQQDSGLVGES